MKNIIYILLSTVLLIACSNDKELVQDNFYASEDSPLTFTMQAPSIIEGEEMNFNKEGLKGYFGLSLQGKDGGYYDGKDYNNMPYQRNGDEWISTGSLPSGKRLSTMVFPITHTLAELCMSASVNISPFSTVSWRISRYSVPTPFTEAG